jgi:hypothetical protein
VRSIRSRSWRHARPVATATVAIAAFAALALVMRPWMPGSAAGIDVEVAPLTLQQTCILSATPSTTVVVADAEVRQGNAGGNFGTISSMSVVSSGSANRRGHVRFDLGACRPAIPATATVELATLRLFMTAQPAVCRTIDIFQVSTAWAETTITWANQPLGTTLNSPAAASRSGSFDVGSPVGCQNRVVGTYIVGATVTDDVAEFVAGTTVNHGWMLRDDVEGSATARTVTFATKQLANIARVPQLVITYSSAP